LNTIKAEKPDVAILNIAMPKLDGFTLARRIINQMESPPPLVATMGFGEGVRS
jgi:DNA-binding response OmpR family regulator